jgi:hypothetical protein
VRAIAGALLALVLVGSPAAAQDPPSGTTATTLVEVPSQDIIPAPGSGETPDEAGDRGGALQLAVLGLVMVALAALVVVVVRQSRRARRT